MKSHSILLTVGTFCVVGVGIVRDGEMVNLITCEPLNPDDESAVRVDNLRAVRVAPQETSTRNPGS